MRGRPGHAWPRSAERDGMMSGMLFDPENRCDLCDKPLLVTTPARGRCDQCVRYGPPKTIAPPIREFGNKGGTTGVPCAGCGRELCHDGATVLPLVEGHCLSCRLDGVAAG